MALLPLLFQLLIMLSTSLPKEKCYGSSYHICRYMNMNANKFSKISRKYNSYSFNGNNSTGLGSIIVDHNRPWTA